MCGMKPHSVLRTGLLLIACSLGAAGGPALAQSASARYGDAGGWHFYETPPPPRQKPVEPDPQPQPQPSLTPAPPPASGEPAALSTAWLRENMQRFQDAAIDNPTPENVELVAYLQRLAMDRAEKYAQATQLVPINNPALDEYARSPITAPQRAAAESAMTTAKQAALSKLASRIGLWYFYSSTCPYCARQEPILEIVQSRAGMNVLPISLDGGPPASGAAWSYVVNQGQAERLGVMTTPTLVVADTETGELHNLAAGLRAVSEIETRLLQLGLQQGWLTAAEYDGAVRGEARKFITDGLGDDPLPDDPASLLQSLKAASAYGGSTPWVVPPTGVR